jgi:uncharacterized membrane protein YhaH (DUF805 family)
MADCYYLDGTRNQQGPVATEEIARLIRSGTIRRDTMVWYAGMSDWRPAGQVNDFASWFTRTPAPSRPSGQRTGPNDGPYQSQIRPDQAAPRYAAKPMGFGGAIKACFYKYADFKGRARRPEYWWWTLFNLLLSLALALVDLAIAGVNGPEVLSNLVNLALFLPSLAVGVRRLHDTDRRGWWILLWLIPLIGWIIIIVFLCQRGTEGPNRFGPDDDDLVVAAEFD